MADRNPKASATFNPLFLHCGWKDLIVEATDTIKLIRNFISSKSCTVLLDEEFLGNNTKLLGLHLKEINPKFCLVFISKRKKSDIQIEPFIDYFINREDSSKKTEKIVQRIINEYGWKNENNKIISV